MLYFYESRTHDCCLLRPGTVSQLLKNGQCKELKHIVNKKGKDRREDFCLITKLYT